MHISGIGEINEQFLAFSDGHVYSDTIRQVEKALIETALERSCGNRVAAAKMLGIHRNTLHLKLKKLDIKVDKFRP